RNVPLSRRSGGSTTGVLVSDHRHAFASQQWLQLSSHFLRARIPRLGSAIRFMRRSSALGRHLLPESSNSSHHSRHSWLSVSGGACVDLQLSLRGALSVRERSLGYGLFDRHRYLRWLWSDSGSSDWVPDSALL